MATEVILPKLGMNMESAKILRWLKHEGDHVVTGEALAEIETDKVNVELEAEAAGVLRKILVPEGEHADVNQVVAVIAAPDEDISEILTRATISPQGAGEHVEQVYESWHHKPQESTPEQAESPRKLDPRAIRERLRQKGALPSAQSEPARTRIVIYGAGLGAKQLLEVTRHLDTIEVVGLIDDNPSMRGGEAGGYRVLGGFDELARMARAGEIDGVALSFHSEVRRRVHRRISQEIGLRIIPLVDPRAIVGMDVTIGDGALVEAGAVVGPGTTIGEGVIVDVGAVVAHDCYLGDFSHLSPGCVLSGVVSLKENVLVGVGAAINSTVNVGRNVIIAPGAAVMNDVPDDVVVSGVPAKVIGESRRGEA